MKPTFTHTPNKKNTSKKPAIILAGLALASVLGASYYHTKNSVNETLQSSDDSTTLTSPVSLQSVRTTATPDPRIQTLQRHLNQVAGCGLVVDGIEGNATRACTGKYQRACMNIMYSVNFGHAGPNTHREVAFHANSGKTLQNCKNSSQVAQTQTTRANRSTSKSTRTSSPSSQNKTANTPIWLAVGQKNNPEHVRTLTRQLNILGCTVPAVSDRNPNDFTLAHQIALEALQIEIQAEEIPVKISTRAVGENTAFQISRLVGHYEFPDCNKTVEARKAQAALNGRI